LLGWARTVLCVSHLWPVRNRTLMHVGFCLLDYLTFQSVFVLMVLKIPKPQTQVRPSIAGLLEHEIGRLSGADVSIDGGDTSAWRVA